MVQIYHVSHYKFTVAEYKMVYSEKRYSYIHYTYMKNSQHDEMITFNQSSESESDESESDESESSLLS